MRLQVDELASRMGQQPHRKDEYFEATRKNILSDFKAAHDRLRSELQRTKHNLTRDDSHTMPR
jgi:hypothetical protein